MKNIVEVIRIKQWEIFKFKATFVSNSVTETIHIELDYNHETGKFKLSQPTQEMISFDGDTIERAEARAQLVVAAVEHLRILKENK